MGWSKFVILPSLRRLCTGYVALKFLLHLPQMLSRIQAFSAIEHFYWGDHCLNDRLLYHYWSKEAGLIAYWSQLLNGCCFLMVEGYAGIMYMFMMVIMWDITINWVLWLWGSPTGKIIVIVWFICWTNCGSVWHISRATGCIVSGVCGWQMWWWL